MDEKCDLLSGLSLDPTNPAASELPKAGDLFVTFKKRVLTEVYHQMRYIDNMTMEKFGIVSSICRFKRSLQDETRNMLHS